MTPEESQNNVNAKEQSANVTKFLGSRRIARLKNKAEKQLSIKTNLPLLPVLAGAVIIVLIVLLAITVAVRRPASLSGFFSGDYKSSAVADFSLYPVRTVKDTEESKVEQSFNVGDPILVRLTFKADKVPAFVTYTVVDNNNNSKVRTGRFPISKPEGSDEDVTRYISIVTNTNTALEAGKYTCFIYGSDDEMQDESSQKELAKYTFTVRNNGAATQTEAPAPVEEPADQTSGQTTEETSEATTDENATEEQSATDTESESGESQEGSE